MKPAATIPGMPNFRATRHGVLSRIAALPVPPALHEARLYGADIGGLRVDALAVRFDIDDFDARFARVWPAGSDAALSYGRRIVDGPDFSIDDALGRARSVHCAALAA